MALLKKHLDELVKGPFAPLLSGDHEPAWASENPDDEHLARLDGMFPSPLSSLLASIQPVLSPTSPSSPSHLLNQEVQKAEICKEALKELRKLFVLTHSPNRTRYSEASLRVWPGNISQDFVELIYESDPRALVILAHYCVLLMKIDHVWYLRGLGRGLLENIWEALGEEWRAWIEWPMEQRV